MLPRALRAIASSQALFELNRFATSHLQRLDAVGALNHTGMWITSRKSHCDVELYDSLPIVADHNAAHLHAHHAGTRIARIDGRLMPGVV